LDILFGDFSVRKAEDAVGLRVLVVDDEVNIRKTLSVCLETDGHDVVAVSNVQDAIAEASRRSFELAFVDLRLGTENGLDLIPALLTVAPWLKIIVITAYASIETAVEAMRRGAADYIPKPFTPAQVKLAVDKVSQLKSLEHKLAALQEDLQRTNPEVDFTSTSPAMQRVLNMARRVAASDATVLLRGERGTGKSVLARAIHGWSKRAHKPLGTVSCPSLSAELLQSELFGHSKGAFTGAVRDNPGRIAACEGGTLLLDEIGDLPLSLQPKLLRFLQDREYESLGDQTTRRADVRIIAATNVDLERSVKEGRFRDDLLDRLNVIQIHFPPLRERPEDVVVLADRLLAFFGRSSHRTFLGFTDAALDALRRYSWPGNVRELRNVVERATILCQAERIGAEHLPPNIAGSPEAPQIGGRLTLQELEEQHIRRVLAGTRSLQEAAEALGIDQATLWRRRKQYGI
jgi:NtrC-family two-component system response regulator AlgB